MPRDEQEMDLERLKNYSNALYLVIIERYKVLPLISTLSAALVGLAIQNTNIIKTGDLATIALFILIALIPISVFGILYQLERDIEHLAEKIETISEQTRYPIKTSNFISIFPWIIYVLFLIAIIIFILSFFKFQ